MGPLAPTSFDNFEATSEYEELTFEAYNTFGGAHSLPFGGKVSGCTYNCRALFAYDVGKYATKLQYVAKLCLRHNFVALQETHHRNNETKFLEEILGNDFRTGALEVWASFSGRTSTGFFKDIIIQYLRSPDVNK